MVIGSGVNHLIVARHKPSSEEVHAVASAIVQGCIAISIVFLALAVGGGEVAAPALTRLTDSFQPNDGCDFSAVLYARVGDNFGREYFVSTEAIQFILIAHLLVVDIDLRFAVTCYLAVAHHKWQMTEHLRDRTKLF